MSAVPIRQVICVDGTWCGPDGVPNQPRGNHSNIYRLFVSIKEGECLDATSRVTFNQKRHYETGIGSADNIDVIERVKTGIWGRECIATIKRMYLLCCDLHEHDEVWLFGFSRGAYIIRAVAGLLHHFGILKSAGTPAFDTDYDKMLALYSKSQSASDKPQWSGRLNQYFHDKVRRAPTIAFVGAFDTVKAVGDKNLYDLSYNESIQHWRHALALNESRKAFRPDYGFSKQEYLKSKKRSFMQAWFAGAHIDIGGSAAKDGLALYPLQWMLLEAEAKGLVLEFDGTWEKKVKIDDPLQMLCQGDRITVTLRNKIAIQLQDLESVHAPDGSRVGKYGVHVNRKSLALWKQEFREPFGKGETAPLNGWCTFAPQGTIIHPSVYLVFDKYPQVLVDSRHLPYRDELEKWRPNAMGTEDHFWEASEAAELEGLNHVRILVCGNAGVGKSTLINRVFGIDDITITSHRESGVHNVYDELKADTCPNIILHDSGGFEVGVKDQLNVVQTFIKEKSMNSQIQDRLHAICELSTDRLIQGGTELLFDTIRQAALDIPVVVVCTKKDLFSQQKLGEWISRAPSNSTLEDARNYADDQVIERVQLISKEVEERLDRHFDAVVVVAHDDKESLKTLVSETERSFTHEKLRILYVSAQIASIDAKIDLAIAATMKIHGHALGSATFGGAVPLATSVTNVAVFTSIVKEVLNIFGIPGINAKTLLEILYTEGSDDLKHNLTIAFGEGLAAVGVFGTVVTSMPVVLLTGAINVAVVVPATVRMMLMVACDVMLILTLAYQQAETRLIHRPLARDITPAARDYRKSGHAKAVHRQIKKLIPRGNVTKSYRSSAIVTGLRVILNEHKSTLLVDSDILVKRPDLFIKSNASTSFDDSDDELDKKTLTS